MQHYCIWCSLPDFLIQKAKRCSLRSGAGPPLSPLHVHQGHTSLEDIEISLSRHFLAMAEGYPWKWSPIDAVWILMRERKENRANEGKSGKMTKSETSKYVQKKIPCIVTLQTRWEKDRVGCANYHISLRPEEEALLARLHFGRLGSSSSCYFSPNALQCLPKTENKSKTGRKQGNF